MSLGASEMLEDFVVRFVGEADSSSLDVANGKDGTGSGIRVTRDSSSFFESGVLGTIRMLSSGSSGTASGAEGGVLLSSGREGLPVCVGVTGVDSVGVVVG